MGVFKTGVLVAATVAGCAFFAGHGSLADGWRNIAHGASPALESLGPKVEYAAHAAEQGGKQAARWAQSGYQSASEGLKSASVSGVQLAVMTQSRVLAASQSTMLSEVARAAGVDPAALRKACDQSARKTEYEETAQARLACVSRLGELALDARFAALDPELSASLVAKPTKQARARFGEDFAKALDESKPAGEAAALAARDAMKKAGSALCKSGHGCETGLAKVAVKLEERAAAKELARAKKDERPDLGAPTPM